MRTCLSLSAHDYQHIMLVSMVFRNASKSKELHCTLVFLSVGKRRGNRKYCNNKRLKQIGRVASVGTDPRDLLIFTYFSRSNNM